MSRERRWIYGLEVSENDVAFLLFKGGGDLYLKEDGKVVGNGEVNARQLVDAGAGGTEEVQGVGVCGWVLWVGKSMCCEKIVSISKSSVAFLQSVESTWMLKLPRSNRDGGMAESCVRHFWLHSYPEHIFLYVHMSLPIVYVGVLYKNQYK